MKKNYIVTGGAGFIGSRLAKRLLELGHQVLVLDDLSTGFKRNIPDGAILKAVDLSDRKKLESVKLSGKVDCIYHLAAQSSGEASFDDPGRDIESNYRATLNLLKLCSKIECDRFIYSSSMSVYGEVPKEVASISEDYNCRPVSYYGINKLASEHLIGIYSKMNDINYTSFRLFSVYGPGQNMLNMKQGIVSIYLSYIMRGQPITVKGSLDRFRDLIYVEDVVDALVASEMAEKTYNGVFNVGTGKKTTVRELLNNILKVYGKNDFNRCVSIKGTTAGDIKGCIADIKKIRKALGWEPTHKLHEGLSSMKKWLDETADLWRAGSAKQ